MTVASAGVTLDGGASCLSAEEVELEVRTWVGDQTIERSALRVRLVTQVTPWQLTLQATRLGETPKNPSVANLWSYTSEVEPIDCPYLPRMIGRIAQQQYAGIPAWRLEPVELIRPELFAEAVGSGPGCSTFPTWGGRRTARGATLAHLWPRRGLLGRAPHRRAGAGFY